MSRHANGRVMRGFLIWNRQASESRQFEPQEAGFEGIRPFPRTACIRLPQPDLRRFGVEEFAGFPLTSRGRTIMICTFQHLPAPYCALIYLHLLTVAEKCSILAMTAHHKEVLATRHRRTH
jgi:hypothetical protein